MIANFILLPFAILPLIYLLIFILSRSKSVTSLTLKKWIPFTSFLSLLVCVYGIINIIYYSSLELTLLKVNGLGIELQLDRLNIILLTMVSIIGMVVMRFSFSYMEGDSNHGRFLGYISGILGSIQIFVLSGNLFIMFISWVLASLFLHQLFIINPNREKAQVAARKKFVLARFGDLALFISFSILFYVFQTGNLNEIFKEIQNLSANDIFLVSLSAVLIGFAAILKSAQLPFHGWLIEVMEAPTPVSAILHAGLINAGPFLIIRFSHVINLSPTAQICLFVVGMLSSIFGALTFVTQPSIKNSLGYSSIAHMGFSLTLCSIGAYSAALLHLTAHSFFKAYSFLSSGSEIDRPVFLRKLKSSINKSSIITGVLLTVLIILSILFFLADHFESNYQIKMIFYLFLFVISVIIIQAFISTYDYAVRFVTVLFCLLTITSFILLEDFFSSAISLTVQPTFSGLSHTLSELMIIIFIIIILLRMVLLQSSRYSGAIQIHLRNGLYVNQTLNKLLGIYKKK